MSQASTVEWTAVILLTFEGITRRQAHETSYEQAMLYLLRERKYFAFHPYFGCKQADWEMPPPERRLLSSMSFLFFEVGEAFTLPACKRTIDGVEILLPYSEELWNALGDMQHALQVATKSISEAITTPKGILDLVGQRHGLFDHGATSPEQEAE